MDSALRTHQISDEHHKIHSLLSSSRVSPLFLQHGTAPNNALKNEAEEKKKSLSHKSNHGKRNKKSINAKKGEKIKLMQRAEYSEMHQRKKCQGLVSFIFYKI